jgi:uncharacterized membrane protein YfcA
VNGLWLFCRKKLENYSLFFLLALLAEILGTVSGFGSSVLFVPIASYFFDFKTVLGITAIFHVFSNLSKIVLFRKGVNRRIAFIMGVPAILFVVLGALLTQLLPAHQLELGLSFMLIILSIFMMVQFEKPMQPTSRNLFWGGSVSGFIAGVIGTGGAIRGITLAAFQLPKDVFISTSAIIDLGVDLSRAVVYTASGYFTRSEIIFIPVLLAISVIGSYLGKTILKRTSERQFRWMVLGVILLTSIFQIVKSFRGD